ncbi:DUF748 domain-containing protein [Variovorax saccharolyticus]|uniref:DUF748 domain-containing protein n=1 Tax=Variovorax saccharolyticus TaxID=3053516 RepID=UPI002577FE03|nr:DUF748 domain-containing protein [Variovorax sp. J31P216]MDM0023314.1 DUF748 domain-containing protein [Variovorax sp. J31P216]
MNAALLKQNKWVRRGALALLILLGVWLVAWLAVPPIVKGQVQKIASEKLGRQVTVGKIEFKPWTLELAVNDLRIATADGSQPQVAVKRLYLDAELQSILRLAPVIDAVRIEAPAIQLTHLADGRYDIDDIIAKLTPAPEPPDAPKKEAPRFAIYNIAITDGAVDFTDQTVERRHELREFALSVPFLSNLASQREIKTEPKLAFVLNGSKFDSAAESTPFAEHRKTDAHISFQALDLVPYLGYIPGGLPVALQAGKLDADLKINFEQAAAAGLKITGSIAANGIKMADSQGRDLLGFESLKIALADVRPLERVVHLSEVALAGPDLVVARDAAGRLNLLATDRATGATQKVASVPAPAPDDAAKPAAPPAWRVQVDKVALSDGQIGWRDHTTQPNAAIDVKQLAIEVQGVAWPMEKPATFSGSTSVGGAPLKFSGEATDKRALVATEIEALPLSLAAPYLAQSLEPSLDGKLSGKVDVEWTNPDLKFKARSVIAEGLALTQEKTALASVGRFELVDAEADMTKHTLTIASFTASNPKVRIERDNEKRWMFERWLKAPAGSSPGATEDAKVAAPKDPKAGGGAPAGANTRPWQLNIATLAVDNATLSYADNASATPVAFEISALQLKAQKLAPNTDTVSPLKLSGRIAAGRAEAGRFEYDGNLVLKPIAAEGRLLVASLPAHAFKAYYADALNIDIRRAFASYRGTVKVATLPAGLNLRLVGDTAVDDFRANSGVLTQAPGLSTNRQLLSWKTLGLRGLQVNMVPGEPLKVDVGETSLTDFFARVIIDPTGKLNLLYLVKKPGQAVEAEAAATEVETKRSLGGTTTTTSRPRSARARGPAPPAPPQELMVGGAPDAPAPVAAAAPAAADSGPAPLINFGPISLVNGKIDFSDLFIKPNYSADLTELTGKLSAFSSRPQGDKPALADLELRGKAQQTASLEITGKLNPLAKPLELDITARMKELDLPPLSPYTIRFAGHGIERGKLSMDVNYKIAPDGTLTAANKVVLNQLQFGEPVEGAPASLPVRLAVALLADRNGVIDIDLPLRGSINDPEFSVGPLILKAIVNLLAKAVTAPFALLTGGFGGGGGESSTIAFAPGSSELSQEAKDNLDKVAKALNDRPGLRMTVVGTSSLDKERDAYQRQRLRAMTQAEKRRAAVRAGKDAAEVGPVSDAEYPELLTAVYKRSEVTKPRNMVGLAKDLPVPEMENLLLASIAVDEESMRQLAVERGVAARDYLLAQKLSSERLFLGAVRTQAEGNDWKPGAELKLATR